MAVSVFPWEIAIEPAGAERSTAPPRTASRPRCSSITELGNRVRLGLAAPQPLAAEVTLASTRRPWTCAQGTRVTASWKAAATRLVAL